MPSSTLLHGVGLEAESAALHRERLHFADRRRPADDLAERIVDDQHVEHGGAANVAGALAVLANDRIALLVELRLGLAVEDRIRRQIELLEHRRVGLIRLATRWAELAHQTLVRDRQQRPGDLRVVANQVHPLAQRTEHIAGVQRGIDELLVERRVVGDDGGGLLAHLRDEHDVGIGTHDLLQVAGKGLVADRRVLDLRDVVDLDLGVVLDELDVEEKRVMAAGEAVHRGRQAGALRGADQHQTLLGLHHLADLPRPATRSGRCR